MFTKSKSDTAPVASAAPKATRPGPPSIIAADMRILGDLETDGDVQVDGQVDGDLRTRSVTIGKSATINGSITGETVNVSGAVNGQINGAKVILASSARVVGDILHDSLSIDAGAFLEGLCKRKTDEGSGGADASKSVPTIPPKGAKAT